MKYKVEDVRRIVSDLMEYGVMDDIFYDMGITRVDGKFVYTVAGEINRQILLDFIATEEKIRQTEPIQ